MRLVTENYEFTHGKKPRGNGNWAWAFTRTEADNSPRFFTGTLSELKKHAAQIARQGGLPHTAIHILP